MTDVGPHARQQQFLEVIDRDEAERRFHAELRLEALGSQTVPLDSALGRVLAVDVISTVDVPSFDRSNYDGFAVLAQDTFGADEAHPRCLQLTNEVIETAVVPKREVVQGQATVIATGGMLPRGADAVVMIEHTDVDENNALMVRKSVTPGHGVAFAGTDIAAGETVLRRGQLLTSRETGVLAAIGMTQVDVWRQPRVAIVSTGNEIIAPAQPMQPARVYDSNARILADAVREQGAIATEMGIVRDDEAALRDRIDAALANHDVVLLSGGTSKGAGDLSYRVVQRFRDPGVVAHGVALKPGKPICLAVTAGKPVVILPGFPTSAIFTFHEFVAPVIRRLGGRQRESRKTIAARLAVKVNSEIGRTEYMLVGLAHCLDSSTDSADFAAYPMGKGSGSVTTFSNADGFVTIDRHVEIVPEGQTVDVQLLGRDLQIADLVVIGSHCIGLDLLLGHLNDLGLVTKFLAVGSTAGLEAAKRGECDVAGIHLLDTATGIYNRPYVTPDLEIISGYGRLQGVVYRRGDGRFENRRADEAIHAVSALSSCLMINRNQGSGTRILIDRLLQGKQPSGYAVQAKSHNAVAAAVVQNRADWGVAIQSVARMNKLGFLPLQEERFDFVVPKSRVNRPAVLAFKDALANEQVRARLSEVVALTPSVEDLVGQRHFLSS